MQLIYEKEGVEGIRLFLNKKKLHQLYLKFPFLVGKVLLVAISFEQKQPVGDIRRIRRLFKMATMCQDSLGKFTEPLD